MKYFKIIDSTKFDKQAKKYFVGAIHAVPGAAISFVKAKDILNYIDRGSWILEIEPKGDLTIDTSGPHDVYLCEEVEVVRMMRLDKVPAYQMLSKEHADFTASNNLVLTTALFHWPGVFNFLAKHWDKLSAGKRV